MEFHIFSTWWSSDGDDVPPSYRDHQFHVYVYMLVSIRAEKITQLYSTNELLIIRASPKIPTPYPPIPVHVPCARYVPSLRESITRHSEYYLLCIARARRAH